MIACDLTEKTFREILLQRLGDLHLSVKLISPCLRYIVLIIIKVDTQSSSRWSSTLHSINGPI